MERQITIYFDPTTKLGRQALADAQASNAEVLGINILATNVTGTEWTKLADGLGLEVLDLVHQNHPVFKSIYGNKKIELSSKDALKILEKHPEVLVYPIAKRGDKYIQFKQSTDMRKLRNPDSKGTNLEH